MKKLFFTLAVLLLAGNAMADRVVTFNSETDGLEWVSQNVYQMSKDGVTITLTMSGDYDVEDLEDWLLRGNETLTIKSDLYEEFDDVPMYEAYYGGISKVSIACNSSNTFEGFEVLRPNGYDGPQETVDGNTYTYEYFSNYGHFPPFVELQMKNTTYANEIEVTLYGVDPLTPGEPTITPRMLTVSDGTDWNANLPVYGFYYDTEGTLGQMIYPAEMLKEMEGQKITQVKFYADGTLGLSGGKIQLALMSVDEYGFNTATIITGATPVATATPEKGATELVFDLEEPYEYQGGNLLVETTVTEASGYASNYFLGVNTSYKPSLYHYVWWGDNTYTSAFLPKATFAYEEQEQPVVVQTAAPEVITTPGDEFYTFTGQVKSGDPEAEVLIYIVDEEGNRNLVSNPLIVNRTQVDQYINLVVVAHIEGQIDGETSITVLVPAGKITGIDELVDSKTVAGVRYYNMAGQEIQEANGMTIVVTTYTDGTTSAVKVMK